MQHNTYNLWITHHVEFDLPLSGVDSFIEDREKPNGYETHWEE